MENKKLMLFGFVILGLIFITSCQNQTAEMVKTCEQSDNVMEQYSCKIEIAKQTKDSSICKEIEEGINQDCFYIVAIEKEDKSLCKKTYEKEKCEKAVIKKIAQRTLNPDKCYELDTAYDDYYEAADCISFIASAKKDPKLCEELAHGFGKVQEECYAKLAMSTQDISLCEFSISSHLDNDCYKTILNNNSDPVKLCQSLTGLHFTYCINNINCEINNNKEACAAFVFKTRNDPNFCENQLNTAERTDCYTRIALELNSPELCLKTEVKPCITKFAIETKNSDICNLGINYDADGNCYKNYADAFKDHQFCNRISDDFQKGQCLHDFAVTTNNVDICYEISNVKREECFWYFADYLNNVSICEFTGNQRDSCLNILAKKRGDFEICQKVNDDTEKERCFWIVAIKTKNLSLCEFAGQFKSSCLQS